MWELKQERKFRAIIDNVRILGTIRKTNEILITLIGDPQKKQIL